MANEEQVALLKKSVSEWNAWREAHPKVAIELRGANLIGMYLRYANLQQAILTDAKLQGADLLGTNLQGGTLRRANLKLANLQRAILTDAKLEYADLQEADLRRAKLQEADLQHAQLEGANLTDAKLQHANLVEATLTRADLQQADLQKANLYKADLQHAQLEGAHLMRAQLQGAQLQQADLQEADLREADLQVATLWRADLQQAQLQGANLIEANLQHADLQQADLQQANLREANLQRANLQRADLQRADLREAILTEADLREAILLEVNLTPAHWSYVKDYVDVSEVDWGIPSEFLTSLSESLSEPSFTRSIEFPPEHKKAGVQILSHFADIVEHKYPGKHVKVVIEQEGLLVKMTITAPSGELLEEVEKDLTRYGAVVLGTADPETLQLGPVGVMHLKHQLNMAGLQLQHQKELHAMEVRMLRDAKQAEQRARQAEVEQLRYDVTSMRTLLGQSLTNQQQLMDLFRPLMEGQTAVVQEALHSLIAATQSQSQDEASDALETIQSEKPELLQRLLDMAQKVSESGISHMLKKLIEAWQEGQLPGG